MSFMGHRSSPIVANLVSSSKVCTYIQVKIQSFVANAWPDSKLPFKFLTLEWVIPVVASLAQ